jgi:hypothetical protein
MQLRYHRKTFDLLGQEPAVSERAVELLAAAEQRCGKALPAAVREWYSIRGSKGILATYSNQDLPVGVEELGAPTAAAQGPSPELLSEGYLVIMCENQGVCWWAVRLDGSEDPPVVVAVHPSPAPTWEPCAETFSSFVYTLVWDWQGWDWPWLNAQDQELTPRDFEFLRERFVELPTTYGWPGRRNYRFSRADQRVLIWSAEGQADWKLRACSPESLLELATELWRCGTLANTLYGLDVGEEIVTRLRAMERPTRQ